MKNDDWLGWKWRLNIRKLSSLLAKIKSDSRIVILGKLPWLIGCFIPLISSAATAPSFTTSPLEVTDGASPGFTRLPSTETGVDFKNQLTGDAFLTDAVAHNGSGLALGDVDGDQLVDIYFCGLQTPNRLYKNLGNWKFKEVETGPAACADQRSTAATLVDVDGDADLDLLVNGIAAGTRLFLNDGTGNFSESNNSGLSRTASATSMALADIDLDGDLDLYCAHYVDVMYTADPTTHYALARQNGNYVVTHVNGEPTSTPRLRNRFTVSSTGKLRELPEYDGLYLNQGNGSFKAIQFEKGTFNSTAGKPVMPPRDWSLAVMFRDMNADGFPDIYVCTDNASPDRVWINNGNGTFHTQEATALRHTSRSSMGIDFADIDRDGVDDFFVVDMFARDPHKRMTQLAKQYSEPVEIQYPYGRPRYNRNTLFMGRENGIFMETALMAGVAASDWSWCPVFMDVDMDGFEDLLVTNGFSFDVMDQDSQDQLRTLQISKHQRQRSRQFHPPFVTPNAAFRNKGDGTFEPADHAWGFNINGISNGMAIGDLDNDGDMDAVINQFNEEALILRNTTSAPRIKVSLLGNDLNTQGVGARIEFSQGNRSQSQVMISGGRYLSSDPYSRMFAVPNANDENISITVRWPNNTTSRLTNIQPNHHYTIQQSSAEQAEQPSPPHPAPIFSDISHLIQHPIAFQESPHDTRTSTAYQVSEFSQGLAWHDIDGDGWIDLWISARRGEQPAIYMNQEGKSFQRKTPHPPTPDTQGVARGWNDGQGGRFWLVANSYRETDPKRQSVIQIFNGTSPTPVRDIEIGNVGISDLEVTDIDGDGDEDLFVATTSGWGRYPEAANAQVWINEKGVLQQSASWSTSFQSAGIITGAVFFHLNQDTLPDLALSTDWGSLKVFENSGNGFVEKTEANGLDSTQGWWTDIASGDFNGDGRTDLVATNRGNNTEFEINGSTNLRIYYGDNDQNGTMESIPAWQSDEHWFPFLDRNQLSTLLPDLPQRIPSHHQYAKTTIEEVLGDALDRFRWLEASIKTSTVFLSTEKGFSKIPLPIRAQLSPAFCVQVLDMNFDGHQDLFMGQNTFNSPPSLTRLDAGLGLACLGNGDGTFEVKHMKKLGVELPGETRHARIADIDQDQHSEIVVLQKNIGVSLLTTKKNRLYRQR